MNKKQINRVLVVAKFPGFDVNDVLVKNKVSGLFEYAYNDGMDKDPALDSLYKSISESKPLLSLKDITESMVFFADISEYHRKEVSEVEDQIVELNRAITLKNEEKEENPDLSVKEAVTVWQNMVWVLEWSLGKRSNI